MIYFSSKETTRFHPVRLLLPRLCPLSAPPLRRCRNTAPSLRGPSREPLKELLKNLQETPINNLSRRQASRLAAFFISRLNENQQNPLEETKTKADGTPRRKETNEISVNRQKKKKEERSHVMRVNLIVFLTSKSLHLDIIILTNSS